MENKCLIHQYDLDFLSEDVPFSPPVYHKPYKIIIADDDKEVHAVTKLMLKDFNFEGRKLLFIDTYSGVETENVLKLHPDTAVLLLDVVMENHHSGLRVVKYLRKTLKNEFTRIILRTGQPGEAPEEKLIRDFDINDYRLKTDMTFQRLNTSLLTALRNYRDLCNIEKKRIRLDKIVNFSSILFAHNTMEDFFGCILKQMGSFLHEDALSFHQPKEMAASHGFVTFGHQTTPVVVAATDKYADCIGKNLYEMNMPMNISSWINSQNTDSIEFTDLDSGLMIKKKGRNNLVSCIFVEGSPLRYDTDLISLFMKNYSMALDNFILNTMINSTQKEIIMTFGRVVEKHFEETDTHVKRISDMIYRFALLNKFSPDESELLKIASTMHDIGKIGIPDAIIKKPEKLNPEEFKIMKTHTLIGHQILCESNLDILKAAAEIALCHHERWDGTGYPNGLSHENIPLNARMMAIIDVYDAMTHTRCYKTADSPEAAIGYIRENKGKHFDPHLATLFITNWAYISEVL